MTKLKVTEDLSKSLEYIISHFNATEIDFLYENYRTLNQKIDLKALKFIKKEDLLRCFFDGFITLKALGEKDLEHSFIVKDHNENLLLHCIRVDNYVLSKEYGKKVDIPFPYTVDTVLNLINTGSWEIVNVKEVSNG